MRVIGLGGSSHDFSACLVEDGKIVNAIEEERITRIKNSLNLGLKTFRCKAVDYCLEAANLKIEDIDVIITNDLIDPKYYYKYESRIKLMNHHLSHAASCYYPSNYKEAAVLVIDGYGSCVDEVKSLHETITYYHANEGEIKELKKIVGKLDRNLEQRLYENSLGMFYLTVTLGIGFNFLQEGKTMGLSAYGTPKYVDEFGKFYTVGENGSFIFNKENKDMLALFVQNELMKNSQADFQTKADLAYAVQRHLEMIIIELCNYLYSITNSKNICLAGGVALNSIANTRILEETPFEQLFIQPAAGDAGTAIGSALYEYYSNAEYKPSKDKFSPYLGKKYKEQDIRNALEKYIDQINISETDNVPFSTASLIEEGNIIGFYQGPSEIGPRALGNRSILADPRNKNMKEIINRRIKHREPFRPFAPIVLEEKQEEFFEMKQSSYYMLFVPPVCSDKREIIPSVTHYDGTGQVQTINKSLNPLLHSVLKEFELITTVPVLLNTSFNDSDEPIVETPEDAITCFLNIDLDYLIMDKYVISKKKS